jgi:prolyl oligopeptidase
LEPDIQKFVGFLKLKYKPLCRQKVGLCALDGGLELYGKFVQNNTTLDISPQEVHDIGLAEMDRIHVQMRQIQSQMGFDGSLNDFFAFLRANPDNYYQSREQIVEEHQALLSKMEERLPDFFRRLPKTPYEVKPMAEYQEKEAPDAYYMPCNAKSGRPGTYYVNTCEPTTRARFNAEALAYHEAVPGHHLQIAFAQEVDGLPEFRKRSSFTAYIEGWALYAEKLAGEMGFYQSPLSRFGSLGFEAWRAARLVVDTGIHAFGWTKEQAVDYMLQNTCLSADNIRVEVERYIVMPGQAVSYKIGELFILELRRKIQEKLGSDFDIQEFHERLLRNGSLPLPVLEQIVLTEYGLSD